MKALSIRQPWAHAIIHLGKTIENRSWNTHYRGPVLIHAGQALSRPEWLDRCGFIAEASGLSLESITRRIMPFDLLQLGGIVGVADLVDVVPPGKRASPWHDPDSFGFVLAGARPLPFVPMKGKLGFFSPTQDTISRLGLVA